MRNRTIKKKRKQKKKPKSSLKQKRGGATTTTNYMNQMVNDPYLFLQFIQFLPPQEIIHLYHSEPKYRQLFIDLKKEIPDYVLKFDYIIDDKYVQWFNDKNINIELHKEHVFKNGNQQWFQNGILHRDDDLPAVIYADGTSFWYQNGLRHRTNAPAVTTEKGEQTWMQYDKRHRDDGPAVIVPRETQCNYCSRTNCKSGMWYQNGKMTKMVLCL